MRTYLVAFTLLLAIVGFGSAAFAVDDESPPTLLDRIDQHVELREGTDGKGDLLARPAQVLFTRPDKGDDTIAVDIGMKVLPPDLAIEPLDGQLNLAPAIEYHRNTAPEKEQDSLKAGAVALAIFGDISGEGILPANQILVSPTYLQDYVKNEESLLLVMDYVPISNLPYFPVGRARGFLGSPPLSEGWDYRWLRIWWLPTLGIEYQNIYAAGDNGRTGQETRVYLSLAVGLYPFAEILDSRLESQWSYDQWYGLSETNDVHPGNDTRNLFQAGLTYWLDSNKRLGAGISFLNGANPRQAKPNQEYWQLSVKAKL